jgi:hypothetical protein
MQKELKIRQNILRKINNLTPSAELELTQDEIKYMVSRWINSNFNDINIIDIKLFHYIDKDDIKEKELIGAKVLR